MVDISSRQVTDSVAVGDRPVGVAVSPDGQTIAVAEMGEDQMRLIEASNLTNILSSLWLIAPTLWLSHPMVVVCWSRTCFREQLR